MKKNIAKILLVCVFMIISMVCYNNFFIVLADSSLAEKLKGKILLQVEDNGEAWYVYPDNLEKYYLGRPDDAFDIMQGLGRGITNEDLNKIEIADINFIGEDSDGDGIPNVIENSIGTNISSSDSDNDGFNDKEELLNNYNPLGAGKISIDSKISESLAGYIVLQVENNGEAWYINPDDFKRCYLGRPKDAFNLMRSLGLGVNNTNLAKITEYVDNSKYSNANIVKNNTTKVSSNKRKYIDSLNNFIFEYDSSWEIRKYPENENVVFLTNSKNDFFLENKAIAMIIFIENEDLELDNFKIASTDRAEETEKIVNNYNAIEQIYSLEYTDKITTILEGEDSFINVSLITTEGNSSKYNSIYNNLIKSVKFLDE